MSACVCVCVCACAFMGYGIGIHVPLRFWLLKTRDMHCAVLRFSDGPGDEDVRRGLWARCCGEDHRLHCIFQPRRPNQGTAGADAHTSAKYVSHSRMDCAIDNSRSNRQFIHRKANCMKSMPRDTRWSYNLTARRRRGDGWLRPGGTARTGSETWHSQKRGADIRTRPWRTSAYVGRARGDIRGRRASAYYDPDRCVSTRMQG